MEKHPRAKICCIVAMSRGTRVIGKKNALPWHIPADLQRFKELTTGHSVIMGRKTFESILTYLGKPLPNRQNIVVTRQPLVIKDVIVCHSISDALKRALAIDQEYVFIIGGAELYQQTISEIDYLYATLVEDSSTEADSFFPEFESNFTTTKEYPAQVHNGLVYQWVDYARKQKA